MNYDHFTSRAKLAVQNAMGKAVDLSHQQVTPTHLLFGLCNDESGVINKVFGLLEANIEDFKKKIIEELVKNPTVDGAGADRVYLTTDSSKALEQAKSYRKKTNIYSLASNIFFWEFLYFQAQILLQNCII